MECIDNHLLYTIKTRRSIRKYTDEPLPENALRHILLAGMIPLPAATVVRGNSSW